MKPHVRHRCARVPQVTRTGSTAWNSSFTQLLNLTASPGNVHYVLASYSNETIQWWRDIELLTSHLSVAFEVNGPAAVEHWLPRIHVARVLPEHFQGDLAALLPSWEWPVTLAVDRNHTWQQVRVPSQAIARSLALT